jgi:subtilisin family serine protease/photosystem II stability/assembly factor-like uncharacterized protein
MTAAKTLFPFLLLFIIFETSFAELSDKNSTTYKRPGEYAYSINMNPNSDGEISKIVHIYRVDPKYYLPGTIHVKTKTEIFDSKKGKLLSNTHLSNSLRQIGANSVTSPFSFISKANKMLSEQEKGIMRILEVNYSSGDDPFDVCADLMQNPDVEYASPVYIRYTDDYTPNDPEYVNQWALSIIEAAKAWDISKGSKDVVIAIVDTGTEIDHEDLKDAIWTNPDEIPNNNKDDDNNGKIDDVNGWDFVGNISWIQAANGQYQEDNTPVNNVMLHGTNVAGCASAKTNNSKGIASTGFGCSILPIKCSSEQFPDGGIVKGYQAIIYAAYLGADIINCSWGGPGFSPTEQDIIDMALSRGSLVIASSGNEGIDLDNLPHYPSSYQNVFTTGASTPDDKAANFSNFGHDVEVWAPGRQVLTTHANNGYIRMDGTSFATPIVSGLAGLLKAQNPDWTPKQIMHQIIATSDNIFENDIHPRKKFYGRVNAHKALTVNDMPGLEVSELKFGFSSYIDDYDPLVATIKINNYLATSENTVITIEQMDNFLSIDEDDRVIEIGTINSGETAEIKVGMQLQNNNPWYLGYAKVSIKMESDGYENYQLIRIPINIQSENTFIHFFNISNMMMPQWLDSHAPTKDVLYAVGNGNLFNNKGGFYKWDRGNNQIIVVDDNASPWYSIFALDENMVFAGNGTVENLTQVYRSTDGGASWGRTQVESTTDFIKEIYFFDSNLGVFIGDPKNGKWGLSYTTDNGDHWRTVEEVPEPKDGEAAQPGTFSWYGNHGWFGTNKGSVLYTSSKGLRWEYRDIENAAFIHRLAFIDDKDGIAIYSENENPLSPKYVANTTNGGQTWNEKVYSFAGTGLDPVYMFSNIEEGAVYVLGFNGELFRTKDLGEAWNPILTEFHGLTYFGSPVVYDDFYLRVFNIGQIMGHHNFKFTPKNAERKVQYSTDQDILFDSTDIGERKFEYAGIENIGNFDVEFISYDLELGEGVEEGEFTLMWSMPDIIPPGEDERIRIKFSPTQSKELTAKLTLETNAEPPVMEFNIKGYGRTPVSVEDNVSYNGYSISSNYPNPCSDITEVNIVMPNAGLAKIDVIDNSGITVHNAFEEILNEGQHRIAIDTKSLSSGIYYLKFQTSRAVLYKKISVLK